MENTNKRNFFKKLFLVLISIIVLSWLFYTSNKVIDSIINEIRKNNSWNIIENNDINMKLLYNKLVSIETRIWIIENQLKEMNKTNFQLNWFKDEIFWDRQILEIKLNWSWKMIDYSQKKYINDRDKIAWEIVKDEFIDMKVEKFIEKNSFEIEKWKKFEYYELKDKSKDNESKEVIVIYLHWHWWNKAQWMNDKSFWWNFNRLKNLILENNWIYITTDVDLWLNESLVWHILLIEKLKSEYKNAKIIIAWASNWWVFLWHLLNSSRINKFIDWAIFLWTILDNSKSYNFMIQNWIPLYIWHWTHDFNPYKEKEEFIKIFNEQWWMWQVEIFKNWVHWTPIRMIDWKETINWILKNTY